MFILFAGRLFNQSTVAEIARISVKDDQENVISYHIELTRASQPPIVEKFDMDCGRMNRRFRELKDAVGCASDRG